jgi:hypothetical protein
VGGEMVILAMRDLPTSCNRSRWRVVVAKGERLLRELSASALRGCPPGEA